MSERMTGSFDFTEKPLIFQIKSDFVRKIGIRLNSADGMFLVLRLKLTASREKEKLAEAEIG